MKIFDNINNVIVISPEVLTIPHFKAIWDEDKSNKKEEAYNYFTYIYHMCDFNSPYANFPDDKKREVVNDDILKNKDYTPSKQIIDAIYKYKELQETPLQRLLQAVKNKVDGITDYLNNTEISDDNIKTILDAFGKISVTVSNFDKLQQSVEKERNIINSKIKGNKELDSDFNE